MEGGVRDILLNIVLSFDMDDSGSEVRFRFVSDISYSDSDGELSKEDLPASLQPSMDFGGDGSTSPLEEFKKSNSSHDSVRERKLLALSDVSRMYVGFTSKRFSCSEVLGVDDKTEDVATRAFEFFALD